MSLGSPDNTKYKSKREKKRLMTINDALETVVNNAVVKHHVSMCSIFFNSQYTWPRYEQHLFLLLS